MTTTDFADLIREASTVAATARADEQAAAEAARDADRRRDEAAAEAEKVRSAARDARYAAGRRYTTILLQLTKEVREARERAVDAVRTGDGDVLALWVDYRKVRARNRARWNQLKARYQAVTGSEAVPDGSWGPVLHDPGRPGAGPQDVESFDQFVTLTMQRVEREIAARPAQETIRVAGVGDDDPND